MQVSRTSNWKPELNRTSVTEEDITKLLNLRESKAFSENFRKDVA